MIREPKIERPRTVESSTSPTRWVRTWSPSVERAENYDGAFDIDLDLQYHIQHCTCSCNHLGYGNYLDYQVSFNNVHYSIISDIEKRFAGKK